MWRKKLKESVRNAKKDLSVAYFDITNELFTETRAVFI